MFNRRSQIGLYLLTLAWGCGGTNVADFVYGGGEPGMSLPEGGEIRHENVRMLGMPVQSWIMVYQFTRPSGDTWAPFPAPADGGSGQFGNCVDERNGEPTWPFTAIGSDAVYNNLSKVVLTGSGTPSTGLDIVETSPPNTVGNSTFRSYDFTYGGGAPGNPPGGFNGTITGAVSQADTDYSLDIGEGAPITYHFPAAYTAPLGIGGSAAVMITNNQDLDMTWTAPPNDYGSDGAQYLIDTYTNLTLFADPTNAANPAQFICFPYRGDDGHVTVPAAVISALPASGLIVNADMTHYMAARDAAGTNTHRFDLVAIYCNISTYQKQ